MKMNQSTLLLLYFNFSGKNRSRFTVRVGTSWRGNFGKIMNISRIIDHPKYFHPNNDYDVSLVELSEPLVFDKRIQPIALPDANTAIKDGTLCMVTGWGNNFDYVTFSTNIKFPPINFFFDRTYT